MSKTKFTLNVILGIVGGFFILGVIRWIGLDPPLANVLENVFYKVFGEPNWISRTIVMLISFLVCYFLIHSAYKKYVKSEKT